jgi:CRP/FNR family transcriptional regulator
MTNISPPRKIDRFFDKFPITNFKKGGVIISSGADPAGIYLLKSGFVRQYLFTKSGSELTMHFFKPGSFFPLFWAINNLPNNYNYQAFDKVEVQIAPKEKFLEFLKSDPEVLFDLSSRLLFGLEGLLTRTESLASQDARSRTIGIIHFLCKHFGNRTANTLKIAYPFTHEDIANLTGLTRETTSRQLENLTKKELISIKNHLITVPDIRLLK